MTTLEGLAMTESRINEKRKPTSNIRMNFLLVGFFGATTI
jgi:hypothetical protein